MMCSLCSSGSSWLSSLSSGHLERESAFAFDLLHHSLVVNGEAEVDETDDPSGQSCAWFCCFEKPLEWLVVAVDCEVLAVEILGEVFYREDDGK